jgi:hypothetical protein
VIGGIIAIGVLAQDSADASRDPALVGRDLGPWYMVPWWISVPLAALLGVTLVWYFVRLGRGDVPAERRVVRRLSIVCALGALVPLVRALTFTHPHEDRVAFAVAWSMTLLALCGCLVLAIVDFILTARRGVREFRELRRETLGGGSAGTGASRRG